MSNYLFAIDVQREEVMVSASPKGSMKITLIERIKRKDDELLFQAVVTLTALAQVSDLDGKLFKAMDSVCQGLYAKHQADK